MYSVYGERSPNVYKVTLCLGELGAVWQDIWLDVTRGAQHHPEFHALNPNGRIPVLIDDAPISGNSRQVVWESGAILFYLAEKHGKFLPPAGSARIEVMQWLFWQMAGLGPMSGQNAHFKQYDLPGNDYAKHRYEIETGRLYRVLDRQLAGRNWIAGDYSIADMACYPWVKLHGFLGHGLDDQKHLKGWIERMANRPAVMAAYERMEQLPQSTATQEERYQAMLPEKGLQAMEQMG